MVTKTKFSCSDTVSTLKYLSCAAKIQLIGVVMVKKCAFQN